MLDRVILRSENVLFNYGAVACSACQGKLNLQ